MAISQTVQDLTKLGLYPPKTLSDRTKLTGDLSLDVRAPVGRIVSIEAGQRDIVFESDHNLSAGALVYFDDRSGGVFNVTISHADPAVISGNINSTQPGWPVLVYSDGALPEPLLPGEPYYVVSDGFGENDAASIAYTPGGSAIATTTDGESTVYLYPVAFMPFPLVAGTRYVVDTVEDATTIRILDTQGNPITFQTAMVGPVDAYTGELNATVEGQAWAEVQDAADYFATRYDLNGFTGRLSLATGTFGPVTFPDVDASGTFVISGQGPATRIAGNGQPAINVVYSSKAELQVASLGVSASPVGVQTGVSMGVEINLRNYKENRTITPLTEGDAVEVVISDGDGGWFVGGDVGVPGSEFGVHIEPNGSIDTGFPSANSTIKALALSGDGSVLYVGGLFSDLGAISSSNLCALNTSDWSHATAFATTVNGSVDHARLSPNGQRLYIAGGFSQVNGQSRSHVAAVNTSDGSLITAFTFAQASSVIYAMALSDDGSRLYISGHNGTTGAFFTAINTTTWAVVSGFNHGLTLSDRVLAIALSADGSKVYGAITDNDDYANGSLRVWNSADGSQLHSAAVNGSGLALMRDASGAIYLGGSFEDIEGVARYFNLMKFDGDGVPQTWPLLSIATHVLALGYDETNGKMYIGTLGGSGLLPQAPAISVDAAAHMVVESIEVGALGRGGAAFRANAAGARLTMHAANIDTMITLVDPGAVTLVHADNGGRVGGEIVNFRVLGDNRLSFKVGSLSSVILTGFLTDTGVLSEVVKDFSGVFDISGVDAPGQTIGISQAFGQVSGQFVYAFPTEDPGVVNAVWNDGGVLKVSTG